MTITGCTLKDFAQILANLALYWGDERLAPLHHPMFIHEFGNTAYVIREEDTISGYLFGFLSQTEPVAYTHLIGVHPEHRRRGIGRQLYANFIAYARSQGCIGIKAITSPGNSASIAFHRRLGMVLMGSPDVDGVPVVKDYAGPGKDRVVFYRTI
jgi:hypothetical protein